MAFNIDVMLDGYEFRGIQTGISQKTGKPWMSLVLEHPQTARQVMVSIPEEKQSSIYVYDLHKGDIITCPVSAVAAQTYNFIRLNGDILKADGLGF